MENLEKLKAERSELLNKYTISADADHIDLLLVEIKRIDTKIQDIKQLQLLEMVNGEQSRKRDLAKLVWDCEQPSEDITCNDGSLHKVKAKKYPKIQALQYARLKFEDGHLIEINANGHRFAMYKQKYEYKQPTTYTRPETFSEFLELNGIEAQDITPEAFAQFAQKLTQANEVLEKAIKEYDIVRSNLKTCQMQYIGLVSQSNKHLYIYEAKKQY
jgi:hypothetical protein